jgi:hypothetical protein
VEFERSELIFRKEWFRNRLEFDLGLLAKLHVQDWGWKFESRLQLVCQVCLSQTKLFDVGRCEINIRILTGNSRPHFTVPEPIHSCFLRCSYWKFMPTRDAILSTEGRRWSLGKLMPRLYTLSCKTWYVDAAVDARGGKASTAWYPRICQEFSRADRLSVWLLLCPSKISSKFLIPSVSRIRWNGSSLCRGFQNPSSSSLDKGNQCLWWSIWMTLFHSFRRLNLNIRERRNHSHLQVTYSNIVPVLALWDVSNMI